MMSARRAEPWTRDDDDESYPEVTPEEQHAWEGQYRHLMDPDQRAEWDQEEARLQAGDPAWQALRENPKTEEA